MAGSGHIAGVVNPPHLKKYQHWTDGKPSGDFDAWVAKAKEIRGRVERMIGAVSFGPEYCPSRHRATAPVPCRETAEAQ